MSRADLLISLVRAGASGDQGLLRNTVEALAAEERAKQHTLLAERLIGALTRANGSPRPANGAVYDKARDFIAEVKPRRSFDDLILPERTREICRELIEEQQRADLLRSHGIEPRHRVLLTGPPGNGKTSLAEALALELGMPFFVVRYDAVIGSYLGETATRLRRVFDYARTTPCLLFFDEFDAIGKERGDVHETGEIKRVVSSLLLQIDDLPSYAVIVAATNHPELLDRAVWRRFQVQLTLGNPDRVQIREWYTRFSRRFDEPIGVTADAFIRVLNGENFAAIEQFGLDIQRSWILNMGNAPLKDVVSRLVNRRKEARRTTDRRHARTEAPPPVPPAPDQAEEVAGQTRLPFDQDAGA